MKYRDQEIKNQINNVSLQENRTRQTSNIFLVMSCCILSQFSMSLSSTSLSLQTRSHSCIHSLTRSIGVLTHSAEENRIPYRDTEKKEIITKDNVKRTCLKKKSSVLFKQAQCFAVWENKSLLYPQSERIIERKEILIRFFFFYESTNTVNGDAGLS